MKPFFKDRSVIIPFGFLIVSFLLWLFAHEMALNYSFNGVVEHVTYDIQGNPTITIQGKEYELGYNNWGHFKDSIEVGDSMVKKKGETFIKFFKKGRKDSITFSHK